MINIFTVDVEEVFHCEYMRKYSKHREFRTPINLYYILDVLAESGTKATFFFVGEIAEQYPKILFDVAAKGHEIAFHTHNHEPLWKKDEKQLAYEIDQFNSLLQRAKLNLNCAGFRAPSFSVNGKHHWIHKLLKEKGFKYDSSVFPAKTPLYGVVNAPTKPYKISFDKENYIWEFPLLVYSLGFLRIPAAGGFWFRFLPLKLMKEAIKKMNRHKAPATIFIHSWEFDTNTPRIKANLYNTFVTYHNLHKTKSRIRDLLSSFEFTSFEHFTKNFINCLND